MFIYLILRLFTLPFAYLPYKVIHFLGRKFGILAYYLIPKFRKRALSNLALSDLALTHKQMQKTAKASIQSLMITCLEYPKLSREKKISRIAFCENPEEADAIMAKGQGVIFFCGHEANWELLFLEGTNRMPGVAIGRPIKNRHLYNWVLRMRQKFGGTIITPRNALKEGMRALKRGAFLGIVGDQGMPDSGFSSPFLGRVAWTSPAPALLSYKTGAPLIVATTRREKGKYRIRYSKALYPDLQQPKEKEVERLMRSVLSLYEASIREQPEQWLWIHNRWKQQTLEKIKRPYRQDSLAIFLPDDEQLVAELPRLRDLYPREQMTIFVPKNMQNKIDLDAEIHSYTHLKEVLRNDFRFKLIYNFTQNTAIDRHYKKLAAQIIVHPKDMKGLETMVRNA